MVMDTHSKIFGLILIQLVCNTVPIDVNALITDACFLVVMGVVRDAFESARADATAQNWSVHGYAALPGRIMYRALASLPATMLAYPVASLVVLAPAAYSPPPGPTSWKTKQFPSGPNKLTGEKERRTYKHDALVTTARGS